METCTICKKPKPPVLTDKELRDLYVGVVSNTPAPAVPDLAAAIRAARGL